MLQVIPRALIQEASFNAFFRHDGRKRMLRLPTPHRFPTFSVMMLVRNRKKFQLTASSSLNKRGKEEARILERQEDGLRKKLTRSSKAYDRQGPAPGTKTVGVPRIIGILTKTAIAGKPTLAMVEAGRKRVGGPRIIGILRK